MVSVFFRLIIGLAPFAFSLISRHDLRPSLICRFQSSFSLCPAVCVFLLLLSRWCMLLVIKSKFKLHQLCCALQRVETHTSVACWLSKHKPVPLHLNQTFSGHRFLHITTIPFWGEIKTDSYHTNSMMLQQIRPKPFHMGRLFASAYQLLFLRSHWSRFDAYHIYCCGSWNRMHTTDRCPKTVIP